MNILRDLDDLPAAARSGAVAIGNFDGVHRGHARIVEQLLVRARQVGGLAVIFSFDPHPVRILRPDQSPPPLTWTARKADLLGGLGVDWLVVYPTDEELLRLSPREFFDEVVWRRLDARAMVEGPNFFFGCDRAGTIDVLRDLTEQANMTLDVVEPFVLDGEAVSSSRIRQAVAGGQVREACRMLTQPYRIRGMVTHGMARGARIGFPTANLDAIDTLLPAEGVYAGRAWLDGEMWPAAVHIGAVPTFRETRRKVEVHLIGVTRYFYGQPLEVDYLERLRDVRPFPSVGALTRQLQEDVERTLEVVQQNLSGHL